MSQCGNGKRRSKNGSDSNYSVMQNDINTAVARSAVTNNVLPNKQLPFCSIFLRLTIMCFADRVSRYSRVKENQLLDFKLSPCFDCSFFSFG